VKSDSWQGQFDRANRLRHTNSEKCSRALHVLRKKAQRAGAWKVAVDCLVSLLQIANSEGALRAAVRLSRELVVEAPCAASYLSLAEAEHRVGNPVRARHALGHAVDHGRRDGDLDDLADAVHRLRHGPLVPGPRPLEKAISKAVRLSPKASFETLRALRRTFIVERGWRLARTCLRGMVVSLLSLRDPRVRAYLRQLVVEDPRPEHYISLAIHEKQSGRLMAARLSADRALMLALLRGDPDAAMAARAISQRCTTTSASESRRP
jgi:hypothetical protein